MKADINLMPVKSKAYGKIGLRAAGILLFSVILLLGWRYGMVERTNTRAKMQGQLQNARSQADAADQLTEVIQNLTAETENTGQIYRSLIAADDSSLSWTCILDNIERQIPQSTKLTNMTFENKQLTLIGQYEKEEDVAYFLTRLQSIPQFSKITIQSMMSNPEMDIHIFHILCEFGELELPYLEDAGGDQIEGEKK